MPYGGRRKSAARPPISLPIVDDEDERGAVTGRDRISEEAGD
jgi:hypothetical protein